MVLERRVSALNGIPPSDVTVMGSSSRYDVTLEQKDDDDYDRLLPAGEHEHLCVCQYRRVNSGDSTGSSTGEHMSTVQM